MTNKRRLTEKDKVLAEAYIVVGSLLMDLDAFDHPLAQHVLDNLAQQKRVHKNIIPWPSFKKKGSKT